MALSNSGFLLFPTVLDFVFFCSAHRPCRVTVTRMQMVRNKERQHTEGKTAATCKEHDGHGSMSLGYLMETYPAAVSLFASLFYACVVRLEVLFLQYLTIVCAIRLLFVLCRVNTVDLVAIRCLRSGVCDDMCCTLDCSCVEAPAHHLPTTPHFKSGYYSNELWDTTWPKHGDSDTKHYVPGRACFVLPGSPSLLNSEHVHYYRRMYRSIGTFRL